MRNDARREITLTTPQGAVRIRSFCSPEEIAGYSFDHHFSNQDHYKSLYTRKDSLIHDAARPEANVVLALTAQQAIIGFGVLANPDAGERWSQLGPGRMIEVRVIEVSRGWRSGGLATRILELMLAHPEIEDKIAYMVGYSWTWDLEGAGLDAQAYRLLLIHLFSTFDFQELETNEPNICLRPENLFMCRLGQRVSEKTVEQFNWLRFGIPPEPQDAYKFEDRPAAEPARVFSLFVPLIAEKLTGLGIYFDWKTQRLSCRACRQWDEQVDWHAYRRSFSQDHPLIVDSVYLNHEQTLRLFDRYGLGDYLEQIIEMIKKGRHLGLECFRKDQPPIHFVHFIHSTPLDHTHIYQGRRSGGVRLYPFAKPESELIREGLDMSRFMSFKNNFAGLPFGGAAVVIQADASDLADPAALGFLGYAFDRTCSLIVPDLGFPADLVDVLRRKRYSAHVAGGPAGPVGPAGVLTARGLFLAIKQAAAHHFGSTQLAGRKIVVQGIGAVGRPLIEQHLIAEDVTIFVADPDGSTVEKIATRFADRIHVLDPADVLSFYGDILIPCAQDHFMDEWPIDRLAYSMIIGAAENIFRADTQDEEIHLARALNKKNIFFQSSWLHNSGGMIGAVADYMQGDRVDPAEVLGRVAKVCRDQVADNLKAARTNGMTPAEQAYRRLEKIVYS